MCPNINYCRLCLQKIVGLSKGSSIESRVHMMVVTLFPGMDTKTLIQNPNICNECLKYVQFSYSMRETVEKNERKIISNLESIQLIEENTCRLCLSSENLQTTICLFENANETMPYLEARDIIMISIMDLDFNLFKKPVVCNGCWQIAKCIYLFKEKCFTVEKILKYSCAKNNFAFLSNKELELLSTCYHEKLQQMGHKYDFGRNIICDKGKSTQSNSILNIVNPQDVYLNNFIKDEDDIFEEVSDVCSLENIKSELEFESEAPTIQESIEIKDEGLVELNDSINGDMIAAKALNAGQCSVQNTEKNTNIIPLKGNNCHSMEITEKPVDKQQGKHARDDNINLKNSSNVINCTSSGENVASKSQDTENNRHFTRDCSWKNTNKFVEIGKDKKKHIIDDIKYSSKESKKGTISDADCSQKKRKVRKRMVTIENEWFCDKCDFHTKYKQHLTRHSGIHNENADLLSCSECVYSTVIKRNLQRHMRKHSDKNLVKCFHCSYSTVTKNHLVMHMTTHGKCQESVTEFKCGECPFVATRSDCFSAHYRAHRSNEKILKCPECYYITIRIHSLKNHIELHKSEPPKKTFKCKKCSFVGKRYTHLVSHMVSHQEKRNFKCNECDYKAKRKAQLVTHMLNHPKGGKKTVFQCPYCKYNTIRKDYLKLHCQKMHDRKEIEYNRSDIEINAQDSF